MAPRTFLQHASALAPVFFASAIFLGEAGCPKCAAPVAVTLYGYPCEYGPCERVQLDSVGEIELSYAFEGGPLTPCDTIYCGDDSGGCGSDPNGRYRVVAQDGEKSWETTAEVTEYSCIVGGAVVELTVGDPPPIRCLPVAEPVTPLAGTVTWQSEDFSGAADLPGNPAGAAAVSTATFFVLEGDALEGEEPALFEDDEVLVSAEVGGARWQLRLPLGDLRERGVGTFPLAAEGDTLSAELEGICGNAVCSAFGPVEATLTVELAAGEGAPWPDIVTDDYVRRYRLSYDSSSVLSGATSSQGCEACGVLAIAFDLSFEHTSGDYGLVDDGSCAMQ